MSLFSAQLSCNQSGSSSGKTLLSDASSLVDLKAEVFRKAQEAKFNRRHGTNSNSSSNANANANGVTKDKIWSKKNTGLDKKPKKPKNVLPQNRSFGDEDDAEWKRKEEESRVSLERKAKLYDQMKGGRHSEHKDRFMVQFGGNNQDEEEGEVKSDEEWVEYQDALGRTRSCMKKDLKEHQRNNEELKVIQEDRNRDRDEEPEREEPQEPRTDLMSEDMRRELLRQKWEKEEEENLAKRSVHYQDVLFDEARSHGAGFYRFNRDEAARSEQKDDLERLHSDTIKAREDSKRSKKKRKADLAKRLKRVRDKKRLKMGLPIKEEESEDEDEDDSDNGDAVSQVSMEQSIMSNLREMREESERDKVRKRSIREWDLGKEGMPETMPPELERPREKKLLSQDEWVSQKRDERQKSFAPPSFYDFEEENTGRLVSSSKKKKKTTNFNAMPPPQSAPQSKPSTSTSAASMIPAGCDFTRPPPLMPKTSPRPPLLMPETAPPLPPTSKPSGNPMEQLEEADANEDEIGPMPRPEVSDESSDEDSELIPPGEVLGAVGAKERLQLYSEHKTGGSGFGRIHNEIEEGPVAGGSGVVQRPSAGFGRIHNEMEGDYGPVSDDDRDYEAEAEAEERNKRGKKAEIEAPCDMGYYNSMKGKTEKYRSGFRSHEAMADAFQFGLKQKKPVEDSSSDSD